MATGKAGKTRARILEAARGLFNSQGERLVSTNHIAAALDMSPGNLYYHFRNKGEIVQALFGELSLESVKILSFDSEKPFTIEDKRQLLEDVVQLMWHYRFVYKDIEYLLTENEQLKNGMLELSQSVILHMKKLYQLMVAAGIFCDMDGKDREALIFNSWMVLVSWVGFVGATIASRSDGEFSRNTIRRGIYQVLMLDKSYVMPAHREAFQQLLDDYYVEV
ncbi:TetR/AcrR family transcriptional regulator [Parendozoicomonas sp. Alg238-R29]|uniref:TetR/AcrR family transcriptional regulator n=1 Tax=Parendozoicomonas sp. Alg238-R29 TaxID=2993446 RepID=UPI00248E55E2|nr:TetR/AcrR family transcriptional regulator [Parendozoicomonas sp. Alg238-R29]